MLLGVIEDALQQVARDIVANGFAVRYPILDRGLRALLGRQITGQKLGHILADLQLAQVLQVGKRIQREETVHQFVGVFHLADGLFVFLLRQMVQAPVLEHPVVQEILVDGGEFVLELGLQMAYDSGIAFHEASLENMVAYCRPRKSMVARFHSENCSFSAPKQRVGLV